MSDKKSFQTTKAAGWFVAGHRIPKGDDALVPKVGHVLELTEAEAKYPLLSGEIEPVTSKDADVTSTAVVEAAQSNDTETRATRRASNA